VTRQSLWYAEKNEFIGRDEVTIARMEKPTVSHYGTQVCLDVLLGCGHARSVVMVNKSGGTAN
jgi:hypothetical protein